MIFRLVLSSKHICVNFDGSHDECVVVASAAAAATTYDDGYTDCDYDDCDEEVEGSYDGWLWWLN